MSIVFSGTHTAWWIACSGAFPIQPLSCFSIQSWNKTIKKIIIMQRANHCPGRNFNLAKWILSPITQWPPLIGAYHTLLLVVSTRPLLYHSWSNDLVTICVTNVSVVTMLFQICLLSRLFYDFNSLLVSLHGCFILLLENHTS